MKGKKLLVGLILLSLFALPVSAYWTFRLDTNWNICVTYPVNVVPTEEEGVPIDLHEETLVPAVASQPTQAAPEEILVPATNPQPTQAASEETLVAAEPPQSAQAAPEETLVAAEPPQSAQAAPEEAIVAPEEETQSDADLPIAETQPGIPATGGEDETGVLEMET